MAVSRCCAGSMPAASSRATSLCFTTIMRTRSRRWHRCCPSGVNGAEALRGCSSRERSTRMRILYHHRTHVVEHESFQYETIDEVLRYRSLVIEELGDLTLVE